jgi:hypothetical protein
MLKRGMVVYEERFCGSGGLRSLHHRLISFET